MALTDKQWKAKLAKVKDWDGVKKQADEQGGSVPDGRYRAKVDMAELTESQSSGREQINLFSEITEEGDYAGQRIGIFLGLDEEKSLPWTIAALRRTGYKIVEPEDIVDAVKSLNDDQPEITIRVKNGFGNLEGSFQKVGEDEIGQEGEQPEEVGEVEETTEEEVQEEVAGEAAEEEAQVEIGSDVSFEWKGETLEGKVKEILEDEGKLKVSSGGKVYPVKAENATLIVAEAPVEEEAEDVQEDPEEELVEEEKPAKKKVSKPVTKKTVAKPAPKKVTRKK